MVNNSARHSGFSCILSRRKLKVERAIYARWFAVPTPIRGRDEDFSPIMVGQDFISPEIGMQLETQSRAIHLTRSFVQRETSVIQRFGGVTGFNMLLSIHKML